jgi:hypothetical protein
MQYARVIRKLNETGHTDVTSMKGKVKIALDALNKMQGELDKLSDDAPLPTWWTNKVAVAVDNLDSMADNIGNQIEDK